MEFDFEQLKEGGFYALALFASLAFLYKLYWRDNSWLDIAAGKLGDALDRWGELGESLKGTTVANTANLELMKEADSRLHSAAKFYCEFLRHDVEAMGIDEDKKAKMLQLIDDMEDCLE